MKRLALIAALLLATTARGADCETYVHRLIVDTGGNWYRVHVPQRCEFVYLRSDACMYRLHDDCYQPLTLPTAGWTVYDTRNGRITAESVIPTVGVTQWVAGKR